MNEPPVLIDGVRVRRFCRFAPEVHPTGRRTIFVEGEQIDLSQVRALVIGENLANGDLVLMHCTCTWKALACFGFESIEATEESASAAYFGPAFHWEHYRPLNATEAAEVETMRSELQAWEREIKEQTRSNDEA